MKIFILAVLGHLLVSVNAKNDQIETQYELFKRICIERPYYFHYTSPNLDPQLQLLKSELQRFTKCAMAVNQVYTDLDMKYSYLVDVRARMKMEIIDFDEISSLPYDLKTSILDSMWLAYSAMDPIIAWDTPPDMDRHSIPWLGPEVIHGYLQEKISEKQKHRTSRWISKHTRISKDLYKKIKDYAGYEAFCDNKIFDNYLRPPEWRTDQKMLPLRKYRDNYQMFKRTNSYLLPNKRNILKNKLLKSS